MGDRRAIAVVGAASVVGAEIVELLDQRGLGASEIRVLGSQRTAGAEVAVRGRDEKVRLLGPGAFEGVGLAFFAAGPTVAGEWARVAVEAGAAVVDLSSRFRFDPAVPLVVPEVNTDALATWREGGIVSCPSSTTAALAAVLAPLAASAGLRRVIVSTYQGAAGAGRRALDALARETVSLLNGRRMRGRPHFPRRLAFNCIPQVGAVEPGGISTHELHVQVELRRVLDAPELPLHVATVRVPAFHGVGMSVAVETETPLDPSEAVTLLREAPGLLVHDGADDPYATPAEVIGSDATHVGRVRNDASTDNGLAFWVATDAVRKGSAFNAVAIGELLLAERR